MIKICGLAKTTLLDYPGHVASTVFLSGCNFRCPFCQNSTLIINTTSSYMDEEEFFNFINKRKGIIEGICISGGEPTLYKELPDFISHIKEYNILIKLDTNGYNPDMLAQLLTNNLLDMVSMDVKGSKALYPQITGIPSINIRKIEDSLTLLKSAPIPIEFRTTIVEEYFNDEIVHSMGEWLGNVNSYYLQSFIDSENVLIKGLHTPSKETMEKYLNIIRQYTPNANIRGNDF